MLLEGRPRIVRRRADAKTRVAALFATLHRQAQVSSFTRGGPISAGWNSTAAAILHTSARAISLPMLEVPGWVESHRLPNAVAVVSALKITARVRLDCKSAVFPCRHAMM